MLRKGLLASAVVLALIVPEVFQGFFESLRQSENLPAVSGRVRRLDRYSRRRDGALAQSAAAKS